MTVTYNDAVATLQSMFPQWEKETLGTLVLYRQSRTFNITSNKTLLDYYPIPYFFVADLFSVLFVNDIMFALKR